MQSNSAEIQNKSLSIFSDIKIKGNDGEEISSHRNVLAARSELFNMLLN